MNHTPPLTIWTNAEFPLAPTAKLEAGLAGQRLIRAAETSPLNLVAAPPDAGLAAADIAFGQPDVGQLFAAPRLRWVHLTTAGYTAYDRDDLRNHLRRQGTVMTNSSGVYDEPCAQHALAMLLSFARQLPASLAEQSSNRAWSYVEIRRRSFLLGGQTIVMYGYGAIAQRLAQLLAPFHVNLIGVRRNPAGTELIPTVSVADHRTWLPQADHVFNILPASPQTRQFFDREVFRLLKPTAYFFNLGRGATVDQDALVEALNDGRIAGAYLDVTDPEPLPPEHPLWTARNCYITPHTAGGYHDEMDGLVQHFLRNLDRFVAGQPLHNRII
jgi:phosphoglycerate dehydrogenase-like enzyme